MTLKMYKGAYAVEVQGLCKLYKQRGGREIRSVDDVNLSIPCGQVFGLLGPNGAGKTTTIKMMCGLVIPSAGRVLLEGEAVAQAKARRAAMQRIGAVLEGTRNVYWRLSAQQNLFYFGRLKGCSEQAIHSRVEPLLHEMDLWRWRHEPVGHFSRGMQQKVAIACMLIADPTIVLLDEPTLGLDVQAARTIKAWVKRLAHEQGKTVIITSHELDMIQEVCDRVVIMRQGRIVADKPVAELLALFRQEHYEIKIAAPLDTTVLDKFTALTAAPWEEGTLLSGPIRDQDSLHHMLSELHSLGLPLVSVHRIEPNLEEVFVRLTDETDERR